MISDLRRTLDKEPLHIVVAHGLDERCALVLEVVLIETHRSEHLLNRIGGYGRNSMFMDVASLNARYAATTVGTDAISKPTLFVSLNGGKSPDAAYPYIKNDARVLKHRTLGIWKVARWRAERVRQVAGVYAGIVRVVYDVEAWAEEAHPKGKRKRFVASREALADSPLVNARVIDDRGVCITDFLFGKEKAYAGF